MGPENEFSDVVITTDGHRREAHSLILAARSAVFRRMLASHMQEGQLHDGRRHIHMQDLPAIVLDQVLEWCYTDSVSNLDLSGSMDLLMAADRLEILGLINRCSQRLSKMLSADSHSLPEALELAQRFSCTALWQCLSTVIAKAGPNFSVEELPEELPELRAMVRRERRALLDRQARGLRERLAMVPAPRPAMVFWRQQLSQADQKDFVEEALHAEGGVPALFHGLRERLPGFLREASQKRWEALDASAKQGFESLAIEDAEQSEHARAHLTHELENVRKELALL